MWKIDQLRSGLRLNEYAESARRFVWNELADWYLESVKPRLLADGPDRDVARAVLVHVFDAALRLLHPVVPFISEALWQRLPARVGDSPLLATAAWPRVSREYVGSVEFERVRDAVNALRALRAQYGIPAAKILDAHILSSDAATIYREEASVIGSLGRATLRVGGDAAGAAAHVLLPDGSDLAVSLGDVVDLAQERAKLSTEIAQLEKQLQSLRGRLGNESFTSRAPTHIVEAERAKERDWAARLDALRSKLSSFGTA